MLSEADIVGMIMKFAAYCGDPAPSAIRYVRGTRADLNRAFGAGIGGDDGAAAAVLVEAIGNFIWPRAVGLVPRRPTGKAVAMVINEATGIAVDTGISPEPHDLSDLGEIHHPAVPE
jgi:hypothetical protein